MSSESPPARDAPRISFEFFPPKSPRASMALWESVQRLAPLAPSFVSVTYGAGGATRERSMSAILAIRDCARLNVAGHLICVGATRAEVLKVARDYAKLGCHRIVALRGDPHPASPPNHRSCPNDSWGSISGWAGRRGGGIAKNPQPRHWLRALRTTTLAATRRAA